MDTRILTSYRLCDGLLKAIDYQEDPQSQITNAELTINAILAARDLGGNLEKLVFRQK